MDELFDNHDESLNDWEGFTPCDRALDLTKPEVIADLNAEFVGHGLSLNMEGTEVWRLSVLDDRLSELKHEIDKLARKANRYSNDRIRLVVGHNIHTRKHRVEDWDGTVREVMADHRDILIMGNAPKKGNHEFMAKVEITDAGNLISARPGMKESMEAFRNSDGHCDHCNNVRQRKEVFIIKDLDTGELKQIGRGCLRDYMGIDDPKHIATKFDFYSRVGCCIEGGSGYWGQSLLGLLKLSSTCIRLFGWCSKGMANASEGLTATSAYAMLALSDKRILKGEALDLHNRILKEASDEDEAQAKECIAWVREQEANSDYMHNLVVLFHDEYISDQKRVGLIVSAISAFLKAKERELRLSVVNKKLAAESVFLGSPGERLKNLKVTLLGQRVIGEGKFGDRVMIKFQLEEGTGKGSVLVWYTSKGIKKTVGEQFAITGTVKEHKAYQGVDQTILKLVKLV